MRTLFGKKSIEVLTFGQACRTGVIAMSGFVDIEPDRGESSHKLSRVTTARRIGLIGAANQSRTLAG